MATIALTDVRLYFDGADLTGASNKVELESELDVKDVTNYSSAGWKEFIGGLFDTTVNASGQWEAGTPGSVDDVTAAALGQGNAVTVIPTSGAFGSLAYLTSVLESSYSAVQGSVGDVAGWEMKSKGTAPVARGTVIHPTGTPRTTSGVGTDVTPFTVPSGGVAYATLHVLSIAGTAVPTITVIVESDDNAGFTTPTTRVTFTAETAVNGQIGSIAGPITDNHWRCKWTISGTNPSFLFAVSLGLG